MEKLKSPGPESNYLDWSWVIDMHLNTTGVGYIINPAIPNPKDSPTFAYNNGAVCSVIAHTIKPANIRFIRHLNKDGRALWNGLRAAHQDSSSGGVLYWMRKLFLSRHQGDNIKPHLEEMAKIFKQSNALTNPERPLTQDDFYTTAIFTSLSPDWLPCVSLLMNEPYVASSQVIAALKQEGLCRKARAEDILDPTTASLAKTRSSSTPSNNGGGTKQCTFCNVDGQDLNTCFNTARILRKAKAQQHQGTDSQLDSTQSNKKKTAKQPSKPAAKAGRTSVAQLGHSQPDDDSDTNYSGSEIGIVTHQAICLLSSTVNPHATGDLNLDLGCSMTMLPDASSLVQLRQDNTPVQLSNQSTVEATQRGLISLPLSVKTQVKALVIPSLNEPLLSVAGLCNQGLQVMFTRDGWDILTKAVRDKTPNLVGRGYFRGN
jgi:hypothetical protein